MIDDVGGNVTDPDDLTVSYSVKELLSRVEKAQTAGFARIEKGLESKADKADIARLAERLDGHENRIRRVEEKQRTDEAAVGAKEKVAKDKHEFNLRLWTALTALATVAAVVATVMLAR